MVCEVRSEPLVSVVLTSYNRKLLVERALLSILNQSYKNLQIIIIDDASTDGTIEVLAKYANIDPRIELVLKSENKGLSHSRNLGVNKCKGKYIAFIDDDDSWLDSEKITLQVNNFKPNSINCGAIINSDDQIQTQKLPTNWRKQLIYRNGFIHTSTVMLLTSHVIKAKGFDKKLTKGIDSDLYRRLVFTFGLDIHLDCTPRVYYELASQNRITATNHGFKKRTRRLFESLYLLLKYNKLSLRYPLPYLRRIWIMIRNI
jgi:glycosyltransferase involved in cell wall biosynthesis